MSFTNFLIATAAPAVTTEAGPTGFAAILASPLTMIVIMVALFYFLLIRPQQNAQKKHAELISAVKKGDEVLTSSGIFGKVTKAKDENELEIEISENTRVRVLRSSVNAVNPDKPETVKADTK